MRAFLMAVVRTHLRRGMAILVVALELGAPRMIARIGHRLAFGVLLMGALALAMPESTSIARDTATRAHEPADTTMCAVWRGLTLFSLGGATRMLLLSAGDAESSASSIRRNVVRLERRSSRR